MLSRLRSAGWPQELIDQMYLDEDTPYAQATGEGEEDEIKSSTQRQQRRYFRSG
jgi:protein PhnA